MAFYIMHDTFISQKPQQSVLNSQTSFRLTDVENNGKRRINFEPKLLLKTFDLEIRQTNELVKIDKKKINNEAKVTKNNQVVNTEQKS